MTGSCAGDWSCGPRRSSMVSTGRDSALHKTVIRQQTGEDILKQALYIMDVGHVAAIEFAGLAALAALGVPAPQ